MSKIGDYILKLRNRFQKQDTVIRKAISYQEAKSVGILFNMSENSHHHDLNNFVADLKKDSKVVTTLAYFERDGSNPYDFVFNFFRNKDITNLGKIKSEAVTQFIAQPFDYLFCINLKPFPPFDHILLNSQARCRIGRFQEGQENEFELMIALQENENESKLMLEMLRYARNMRTS